MCCSCANVGHFADGQPDQWRDQVSHWVSDQGSSDVSPLQTVAPSVMARCPMGSPIGCPTHRPSTCPVHGYPVRYHVRRPVGCPVHRHFPRSRAHRAGRRVCALARKRTHRQRHVPVKMGSLSIAMPLCFLCQAPAIIEMDQHSPGTARHFECTVTPSDH